MNDRNQTDASLPLHVVCERCAAYLVSTAGDTHAVMVRQRGESGAGAAVSVDSKNGDTSAVLINGVEEGKGTVKVVHAGYADGRDRSASALSIDLRVSGTRAQGIFVTASEGATGGNLIVLRNNDIDDFVVKGSGRVGVGVDKGVIPRGALEIVQRDTTSPAVVVTSRGQSGAVIRIEQASGQEVFAVDAEGCANVARIRMSWQAEGTSSAGGSLFVDEDGWLTFEGMNGTITRIAGP